MKFTNAHIRSGLLVTLAAVGLAPGLALAQALRPGHRRPPGRRDAGPRRPRPRLARPARPGRTPRRPRSRWSGERAARRCTGSPRRSGSRVRSRSPRRSTSFRSRASTTTGRISAGLHPQDCGQRLRRRSNRRDVQTRPHGHTGRPEPQRHPGRPGGMPKPKILRIGIVQGGRIVEERLVRQREHITIGQSAKNMFVVPSDALPRQWMLFTRHPARVRGPLRRRHGRPHRRGQRGHLAGPAASRAARSRSRATPG